MTVSRHKKTGPDNLDFCDDVFRGGTAERSFTWPLRLPGESGGMCFMNKNYNVMNFQSGNGLVVYVTYS